MLKSAAVSRIVISRTLGVFAIASLLSSFPRTVTAAESGWRANLSQSEATAIGNKVWRYECGGRIDGLTSWNVGEDFPSLGIGHFIWYPKNQRFPLFM